MYCFFFFFSSSSSSLLKPTLFDTCTSSSSSQSSSSAAATEGWTWTVGAREGGGESRGRFRGEEENGSPTGRNVCDSFVAFLFASQGVFHSQGTRGRPSSVSDVSNGFFCACVWHCLPLAEWFCNRRSEIISCPFAVIFSSFALPFSLYLLPQSDFQYSSIVFFSCLCIIKFFLPFLKIRSLLSKYLWNKFQSQSWDIKIELNSIPITISHAWQSPKWHFLD